MPTPKPHAASRIGEHPWGARSIGLVALFVVIGTGLGLFLKFAEEVSDYGYPVAIGLLVMGPVGVMILVRAIRQGLVLAGKLRKNWTWWHPLWFLMFFSMLVFRTRGVQELNANPLDPAGLARVISEGVVDIILVLRLVTRKPFWLPAMFRGVVGAMGFFALTNVVSTAWAYVPLWTAYRSIEFFFDVALLAAIVAGAESWITFENLLNWTITFYGMSMATVWIGMILSPTQAFDGGGGGRLQGIFPEEASNAVGSSGATIAIIALCRLFPLSGRVRNRAWYVLMLLLGMISLLLSRTRSVEGALVPAVAVVVLLTPQLRKIGLWGAAVGGPVLATGLLLYADQSRSMTNKFLTYFNREQSSNAIETMSGRTDWWAFGFHKLAAHPLTGLGAYQGRFAVLDKLGVGSSAMMHSDWVEIAIGTSFWGIIPFALALIWTWYYLLRCARDPRFDVEQRQLAVELIGILAMLTPHSFFNNELAWHIPLLYFTMLGFAECIRRTLRARKAQNI